MSATVFKRLTAIVCIAAAAGLTATATATATAPATPEPNSVDTYREWVEMTRTVHLDPRTADATICLDHGIEVDVKAAPPIFFMYDYTIEIFGPIGNYLFTDESGDTYSYWKATWLGGGYVNYNSEKPTIVKIEYHG